MPLDTQSEMVLGFAVILGILIVYALTLLVRSRKLRQQEEQQNR